MWIFLDLDPTNNPTSHHGACHFGYNLALKTTHKHILKKILIAYTDNIEFVSYLDLSFHVLDGITGLNLQSDGLSSESLDEDLHTSSQSQDKMEGGLLLNVVIWQSSAILKLLSSKDQSLLIWRDTFLVLEK